MNQSESHYYSSSGRHGESREVERRKTSSTIIKEEYIGQKREGEVRYVEVPVIEEVIRRVPKTEIVEVERVVPKYEYEYVDRIVEMPQIQYVDRQVEVGSLISFIFINPSFPCFWEMKLPTLSPGTATVEMFFLGVPLSSSFLSFISGP